MCFALDPKNKIFSGTDLDQFERIIGPVLPRTPLGSPLPPVGRLGQSLEGWAKQPIFAIGNSDNQRVLKPVHDSLMEVLIRIQLMGRLIRLNL